MQQEKRMQQQKGEPTRAKPKAAGRPAANMHSQRSTAQAPEQPRSSARSAPRPETRARQSTGSSPSQKASPEKKSSTASSRPAQKDTKHAGPSRGDTQRAKQSSEPPSKPDPRIVVFRDFPLVVTEEDVIDWLVRLGPYAPGAVLDMQRTVNQLAIEFYTVQQANALKDLVATGRFKIMYPGGKFYVPTTSKVTIQDALYPAPAARRPGDTRWFGIPKPPLTSRICCLYCKTGSPSWHYMREDRLRPLMQQAGIRTPLEIHEIPARNLAFLVVHFPGWRAGAKQFMEFAEREMPDAVRMYVADPCHHPIFSFGAAGFSILEAMVKGNPPSGRAVLAAIIFLLGLARLMKDLRQVL